MGKHRVSLKEIAKLEEVNTSQLRKRNLCNDGNDRDLSDLKSRIADNDRFFGKMLNMFPKEFVAPKSDEEEEVIVGSKYMKNQKGNAPKQMIKEQSKKSKKARLDAVSKDAAAPQEKKHSKESVQKKRKIKDAPVIEDEFESINLKQSHDFETDFSSIPDENMEILAKTASITPSSLNVSSVEALHEKMQARMLELRNSRKSRHPGKAPHKKGNLVKKELATKNLKSKIKKSTPSAAKNSSMISNSMDNAIEFPDQNLKIVSKPKKSGLPVDNLGNIEFNDLKMVNSKVSTRVVGKPGSKTRRLNELLKEAEDKQRRLQELKKTKEGKEVALAEIYEDAILAAAGAGKKDNTSLLRKAIKRRDRSKSISAKEWGERKSKQEADVKSKQNKRTENLKSRKSGGKGKTPVVPTAE